MHYIYHALTAPTSHLCKVSLHILENTFKLSVTGKLNGLNSRDVWKRNIITIERKLLGRRTGQGLNPGALHQCFEIAAKTLRST